MSKVRLYPHRVASPRSVYWRGWWVERDGARAQLPKLLAAWDYATDVTLGLSLEIEPEELVQSTGIASLEDVDVVAIADCKATQVREIARVQLANASKPVSMDIRLDLPAGRFASELTLSAHLVLGRHRDNPIDRVAYQKGSLLASSEPERLQLEGDASRFPTEPVAFSSELRGDAPWTLLCTYEDFDDSFMATVRLLVNTEHPAGLLALDPESSGRVEPLMRTDVVRQLIAGASKCVDKGVGDEFDEGSVGEVLGSMSWTFLGRSLKSAIQLYDEDPQQFELLLHERLKPSSVVVS